MRALFTSLSVASLVACSAPPSKLPEGEVLSFGVGHRDGSYSFVVRADGSADYQESGGGRPEKQVSARVTPEELGELARVLRETGFCSNRSTRGLGVPDEAKPRVRVRLEGLDCEVQMWDGEFRDDPDAFKALRAVESLGSTIRDR